MLKNPYATYINGRTHDWVKLKPFDHIDLPVIGVVLGTEGLTKDVVSKLIVDFNGVEVGVGSGLSAKQRIDWVDPEKRPKMVEVKYQSITLKDNKPHSLEFPILSDKNDNLVLVETRDDH
jgi:ATP-dependent DNA ligase